MGGGGGGRGGGGEGGVGGGGGGGGGTGGGRGGGGGGGGGRGRDGRRKVTHTYLLQNHVAIICLDTHSNTSTLTTHTQLTQEQRSWLRLIHCYLLPLISLYHEDLPAVKGAQASHFELLASLDQQILGNSSEIMKVG